MDNREANRANHPPACTCVDCVNKRLAHFNDVTKFNTKHRDYKETINKNVWTPIPPNNGKQKRLKHHYPRYIRIISNIILSLAVILLVVLLATTGYAISKYHGEAWDWVSQSYRNITHNVSSWFSSISIQNTESLPNATIQITTQTAQKTQATTKSPVVTKSFETMFNDYRVSFGLSPLEYTEDLNRIAKLRLEEIKVSYNHTSIGGYNKHLAENINMISSGYLSDKQALDSWISSSGHRANILNPNYKYTGYANGGGYAVQVFTEYPTINGEPQLPPGWHWTD